MNKKVMIGCPVRNRAWILPCYLEHIQKLSYPRYNMEYCFVINDCTDETPEILENFVHEAGSPVRLIVVNYGQKQGYVRGSYSFSRLADLRNLLLEAFLESKCEYLFSLDSDILVPSDALSRLLENNCDIIAALVCNGHEIGNDRVYNILHQNHEGRFIHMLEFPRDRIFKVDCTGAAYLIKRRVIEQHGVRYSAFWGPEDIGFCQAAIGKGIDIYCDGRIECVHVMNKDVMGN